MKKFVFLTIIFFIPIHAFIIEYMVFKKENAPSVHLLFDLHTEDTNDEMYPMEKQHQDELLQFLFKNKKDSKVLVEDLEELTAHQGSPVQNHIHMLDLLAYKCREKGIRTVNVDCRALFTRARIIAGTRCYFANEAKQKKISQQILREISIELDNYDVSLHEVLQEFKNNIDMVKSFTCEDTCLSEYFQKQVMRLQQRFNKSLGLLKDTNRTLYQNVCSLFKKEKKQKLFLQMLKPIDHEFIDMRALYEVYTMQKQRTLQLYVILGALHSRNVGRVLLQLGYKKVWNAVGLDFTTCKLNNLKAINLLQALQSKKIK